MNSLIAIKAQIETYRSCQPSVKTPPERCVVKIEGKTKELRLYRTRRRAQRTDPKTDALLRPLQPHTTQITDTYVNNLLARDKSNSNSKYLQNLAYQSDQLVWYLMRPALRVIDIYCLFPLVLRFANVGNELIKRFSVAVSSKRYLAI